jgi:hypothetical protein
MTKHTLTEMPSSLNDACRKLDIASDEIARLRRKLTEIHDITQDPDVPAFGKVDNIAATASSALSFIVPAEEYNEANDFYARGEHMPGVTRWGKGSTAMDKAIGIAFWAVVGPIILCGLVYAVGETVEHFTIQ